MILSSEVDEMKSGQPWSIHQWRHGGDLQGVKGRLSYLNQLGVSTVVLSPIFLNAEGGSWGMCWLGGAHGWSVGLDSSFRKNVLSFKCRDYESIE